MKCYVVLGQNVNLKNYQIESDAYIIGVERGALAIISQQLALDCAIGDFDSVDDKEYVLIKKQAKDLIKLDEIKDDTDTACALSKAYEISKEVIVLGGIEGNRCEHFLANICFFKKYSSLKMMDDNSIIYTLQSGKHLLEPNEYHYISFFALKPSQITLINFKYPLQDYQLFMFDPLCISNEVYPRASINLEGEILVIRSKRK